MIRRRLLLPCLTVFLLLLSSCGTDSADNDAGGEAPEGNGDAPSDTTQVDDSELNLDATLIYAAANAPSRLDPHRSSNGFDQNWLAPAYDRLIDQEPDGSYIPGLATEWEFVDELTFEMTLRDDVTFHDGEPFNAEAVQLNIDRAKNIEGSGVFAYLEPVESVEVIDDYHVRFHLNQPDSTLPNQLATRPGMMMSPAAFDNPDIDSMPVGSGPFKIVEYRETDRAIFERNEDYWGELPKLKGLELVYMVDPTTRLNAFLNGEIDATTLNANDVAQAEAAGFDVDIADGVMHYHLFVNRTLSEFGDVRVRQAMEHAIDREALVEHLAAGYGTPSNQWVPEGTPYFNEEFSYPYYDYDPERSRELLEEAGLPDGFEFELLLPNSPDYVRMAEVLQSQWADVGIDVTLRQVAASETSDIFFVRLEGMILLASTPGRIDPAELAQIYFNPESFSNPGGHSTPEVVEAWKDALAASEEPERTETRKKLVGLFTEQALDPVLYYPQVPLAASDDVVNLEWYITGHIEFKHVGKKS